MLFNSRWMQMEKLTASCKLVFIPRNTTLLQHPPTGLVETTVELEYICSMLVEAC